MITLSVPAEHALHRLDEEALTGHGRRILVLRIDRIETARLTQRFRHRLVLIGFRRLDQLRERPRASATTRWHRSCASLRRRSCRRAPPGRSRTKSMTLLRRIDLLHLHEADLNARL